MKDANGNPGVIDLAPYIEAYKDQLGDLTALLSEDDLYYDKDPATGALYMIEGRRLCGGRANRQAAARPSSWQDAASPCRSLCRVRS